MQRHVNKIWELEILASKRPHKYTNNTAIIKGLQYKPANKKDQQRNLNDW